MATRLELVNDLRALLREETVTSTTDVLSTALLAMIKKAGRKVLAHTWSFNTRDDGQLTFEAPIEPTVSSIAADATSFTFTGTAAQLAALTKHAWRFFVSDATTYAQTTYRVTSVSLSGSTMTVNFNPAWLDDAITDPTVKLFANEQQCPTTVGRMLSIRHQERPLKLEFVERHLDFDASIPRQFDVFRDPEVVYAGGTVMNTFDSTGSSEDPQPGIMIWPPPAAATPLTYSYIYKHAALTSDTDTYAGVPEAITDLIVDRAFLYCLTSSLRNDPKRASQVRSDFQRDEARERREDRPALRRRIPRLFGSPSGIRNPWANWNSQSIESPYPSGWFS